MNIEKPLKKGQAFYCTCKTFLVKSNENGWLEFPKNVKVSSNGEIFKIKCKCGNEINIKIK